MGRSAAGWIRVDRDTEQGLWCGIVLGTEQSWTRQADSQWPIRCGVMFRGLRSGVVLDRASRREGLACLIYIRYRRAQPCPTRRQNLEIVVQENFLAPSISPGRSGDRPFHRNARNDGEPWNPAGKDYVNSIHRR